MRELPGVNDIFNRTSAFNGKLVNAVNTAKRTSLEDYIAIIGNGKTLSHIEDPIEWVGVEEASNGIQYEIKNSDEEIKEEEER